MKELVDTATSYGHRAVAITDNENVHIIPAFYQYAKQKYKTNIWLRIKRF